MLAAGCMLGALVAGFQAPLPAPGHAAAVSRVADVHMLNLFGNNGTYPCAFIDHARTVPSDAV